MNVIKAQTIQFNVNGASVTVELKFPKPMDAADLPDTTVTIEGKEIVYFGTDE